ncbi:hypothetical protein [Myxococcus sp. Y35]|uniref:hypothetical protein n=1 Tax=Pseudomyxococcus flavus TaxID=3115648 RepID=UPI003CF22009
MRSIYAAPWLLLALIPLTSSAQFVPMHPCPDGTYRCREAESEQRRKASLEKLRAECLPQLEEASRTLLKSLLPHIEVTLALSDSGGTSTPEQPYSVFMHAACSNKAFCDAATVTLELPPQWGKAPPCTPTTTSLLGLDWNGGAIWKELLKTNAQVKLHPSSAKRLGLKAKSLRLRELLKRLRTNKEYELVEDADSPCSIDLKESSAACFPYSVSSKETGDTDFQLTFFVKQKEGTWQLVPGSLTFS